LTENEKNKQSVIKDANLNSSRSESDDSLDSENDSDENFLPFKKYPKQTRKKKRRIKYQHKLNSIKTSKSGHIIIVDELNLDNLMMKNPRVISEWLDTLQNKKNKEVANDVSSITKQRIDAVWKKIRKLNNIIS